MNKIQDPVDLLFVKQTLLVVIVGFIQLFRSGLLRSCFSRARYLPRSLCDAWKLTLVSHLAEADTADAELLVDSMWTTTTLATGVSTNLELRLASSFNLERCLCH